MRAATGKLVSGAHAVLAMHRDDLFGRASIRDQHAGKMHLTPSGTIFGYQFSTTVLTLGTMTLSRTSSVISFLPPLPSGRPFHEADQFVTA
jgi:hypothetical protein